MTFSRTRGSRLGAVASLACGAALALIGSLVVPTAAHAASAPGSVPPDQDPFYTAPGNIGAYRPGQIIASRSFTPVDSTLASTTTAWQISFRTNESHGRAEIGITSLLVPKTAWTGPGARPVVSVEAFEDSTGSQCAPSYGLANSSELLSAAWPMYITPVLKKNWAVAMPDFEGPKSEFMTGLQAGHASLDGIRAVRNFAAGGITANNPWAVYGYSGGGEASGWTAQLQPSYAPELHLAGVAMGGTPADPAAVARSLDGGLFSGYEAAAAASLDAEYPEAGLQALLNDKGRDAISKARGKCLTDLLTSFAFQKLSGYTTVPDPLSVPSVAAVLKANTLGGAAPAAPIYDYHAIPDEIVPVAQDDALVATWCSMHVKVQKVRDLFAEHNIEELAGADNALAFLADRFAGKPAPSTC
jgi:secretory lipase